MDIRHIYLSTQTYLSGCLHLYLRPPHLGPSLQTALSTQPPLAPRCARGCCSKLGFNFSYGPVLTPSKWRNICIAHL